MNGFRSRHDETRARGPVNTTVTLGLSFLLVGSLAACARTTAPRDVSPDDDAHLPGDSLDDDASRREASPDGDTSLPDVAPDGDAFLRDASLDHDASRREFSQVGDATCAIPAEPRGLVLGASRHVIPHYGDDWVESGEIIVTGDCTFDTECIHVSAEALDALAAKVRALGPIRHREVRLSPHHGMRRITARWAGGECRLTDGGPAPIDDRDRDAFYEVYHAIVDTIVRSKEQGAPPPADPAP